MATIPLGALCKKSRNYVYPKVASKTEEYICPECNRDLILVKGNQRIHHFRHKINTTTPCMHYDNPGESQIHKDAKLLLKTLIENNMQINIYRRCECCTDTETFEIPNYDINTSKIILEYRFDYNGLKIADIAYLDNNEIVCIFEICHTHATKANDRPEPWFEIDATTLLLEANKHNSRETLVSREVESLILPNKLDILCIRKEKCEKCVKKHYNLTVNNINLAVDKLGQWLKERKAIMVYWSCPKIGYSQNICGVHQGEMDFYVEYRENDKVIIDSADSSVVFYNGDTEQYRFQLNSSKYSQSKNNYWIDPSEIEIVDEDDNTQTMILTCRRDHKDRYCYDCQILSEPWVLSLPKLFNRIGHDKQWRQEQPCILCKRTAYSPVYVKGYRQICKICLGQADVKKLCENVKNKCIIDMSNI